MGKLYARKVVVVEVVKRDPLPKLWDYRYEDKTTWPYLDCVVGGTDCGKPYIVRWIKNPQFRFVGKFRP